MNNITTIGHQVWQISNLKTSHFRNGEPIMEVYHPDDWYEATFSKTPAFYTPIYQDGALSHSGHSINWYTMNEVGYLYNWYAVNDPRGLAPYGWLLPKKSHFEYLLSSFPNTRDACIELKSTDGWKELNLGLTGKKIEGNGTNKSGFCAKPIPTIDEYGEFSFDKGVQSFWMNEAKQDPEILDHAFTLTIGDQRNHIECGDNAEINIAHMGTGLPVRCLRKATEIEVKSSKAVCELLQKMEDSAIKDEVLQIVEPWNINCKDIEW